MIRQPTGLQGLLERGQLMHFLEELKTARATGKLELESFAYGESGLIQLESGEVTHLECNRLTGKFALIRISSWHDVRFRLSVDTAPELTFETIPSPVSLDVIELHLDLNASMRLLPPPANLAMRFDLSALALLPLIQPGTTLNRVNQQLHWSEKRLRQVAAILVQHQLLEVGFSQA